MERLLIFLAVLIVIAIGVFVLRTVSRGRRPPLRMDSDFHDDATDLIVGPLHRGKTIGIDRSAEVLEASSRLPAGQAERDR